MYFIKNQSKLIKDNLSLKSKLFTTNLKHDLTEYHKYTNYFWIKV